MQTATVVASFGRRHLIETQDRQLLRAQVRNRKLRPLCGDQVGYQLNNGDALLEAILPRKDCLWRQDKTAQKRVVAANVTTMLIVAAPEPATSAAQIDRYLAIAKLCDLEACLVLNKTDSPSFNTWSVIEDEYAVLGYPVLRCSAREKIGLAELYDYLAQRKAVVAGLSGAGKSSLINALIPDLDVRTAALSQANGSGRHTTTASRLYRLPERGLSTSGWIIDAPGVRDIRLWPMSAAELAHGFIEFADHTGRCKFNNCRHLGEPGCALQAAVAQGDVSERRYENFRALAMRLNSNIATTP